MRYIVILVSLCLMLWSCEGDHEKFPQADIEVEAAEQVSIHRYGKSLFEIDTTNFKEGLIGIQEEFRMFLDADLNNPENIQQLYDYATDTQLLTIYRKVVEVYPDLEQVEGELATAFARYKYYFPEKKIPAVYTYVSDMYYETPVWLNEDALVIGIDIYLGQEFPLYFKLGLPLYKVRTMSPENLVVDIMKTMYLTELISTHRSKTLLDRMIEGGKMLVFLDAVLPQVPDSIKISYTADKLHWAEINEENIWAYLIESKLLYSTDHQTQTKLIQDGPFTTDFSNESPSRLGIFIGWQIVIDYMNNNPDVTLPQLIRMTDSQTLLQSSAYKP